jgi:CDP-diacylglycerol--glycerol-3-phosphate 3-phosphatidyltransferase
MFQEAGPVMLVGAKWHKRGGGVTLANRLTSYRIVLTVLFMFLLFTKGFFPKLIALLTFLLASLTDYWDGKIARERGQVSRFGKLMDPIADKILALSAFMAFVQMGIIPAWMVLLILTRDFLITGLRFTLPDTGDLKAARRSGKHKTVLQFASIVGVLIFLVVHETAFWQPEWTQSAYDFIFYSMFFIVAVTLWSGVRYVMKNLEVLNENLG